MPFKPVKRSGEGAKRNSRVYLETKVVKPADGGLVALIDMVYQRRINRPPSRQPAQTGPCQHEPMLFDLFCSDHPGHADAAQQRQRRHTKHGDQPPLQQGRIGLRRKAGSLPQGLQHRPPRCRQKLPAVRRSERNRHFTKMAVIQRQIGRVTRQS